MQDFLNAAHAAYSRNDIPLATKLARTVIDMTPEHARGTHYGCALAMLSMFQMKSGRDPGAALDHANRSVVYAPGLNLSHSAMGTACRAFGLLPLAIRHLREALAITPEESELSRQLGMTLIQNRNWEEGWAHYERRPTIEQAYGYQKPTPAGAPEWLGEDLTGSTVLLLGENGRGDQIQCLRFISNLLALPLRRLVIFVHPALVRLVEYSLARYPGSERAEVQRDAMVTGIHYVLATESLGHRFGANGQTLPGKMPYLHAPEPAVATEAGRRRLRVGIAWRGEPRQETDSIRSSALRDWRPLLQIRPDIEWISLQHGDHRPEEQAIADECGLQPALQPAHDYLDTATVINGLDLVISVDTSVAHLAGALGKPVWLLNRATGEWRWGWKETRSPWYPSMRIFNQETLFDWQPALQAVAASLPPPPASVEG